MDQPSINQNIEWNSQIDLKRSRYFKLYLNMELASITLDGNWKWSW